MNKEETIRSAVQRLIEQGKLEAAEAMFSPNYIAHSGEKSYEGHEFIKRWVKQLRATVSDIKIRNIDFIAHEDQSITWQRTITGRHTGKMMGIPPSDEKVTWIDMVVTRFEAGKIAEEWVVSELAGELLSKVPAKV